MKIYYANGTKHLRSPNYNFDFDVETGHFSRWGATKEEDPKVGLLEIFDLEVSTICHGVPDKTSKPQVCKMCYKSNTKSGENMSFETFKTIFDKLPLSLTQIAFGIGDIDANPDLIKMMEYCRNNEYNPNVVPNLTINGYGLTDEWVETLARLCGGIAVSRYENKDVCYDAVKKLTDAGIAQCNIHQVISNESLPDCYNVVDDVASDPRLSNVKAVVFLTLKPKGKRNKWTTIKDTSKYRSLIEYAFSKNVGVGFDSCSAPTFLAAMKGHQNFARFEELSESCESTLFSLYGNVLGEAFPCSFTEGEIGWETGVNLVGADFQNDVWNSEKVVKFRNANLATVGSSVCGDCRLCVTYPDLYDKSFYGFPDTNNLTSLPSDV